MPSHILASEDHKCQSDGNRSPLLENFHIPILPKIGVYMNCTYFIFSSVIAMLVSVLAHDEPQNYALFRLIPCFVIGFMCGATSVVFGFLSLQMSSSSAGSRHNKHVYVFEFYSKLLLSASVTLMVISNVIFLMAGGRSVYVVASLFLSR